MTLKARTFFGGRRNGRISAPVGLVNKRNRAHLAASGRAATHSCRTGALLSGALDSSGRRRPRGAAVCSVGCHLPNQASSGRQRQAFRLVNATCLACFRQPAWLRQQRRWPRFAPLRTLWTGANIRRSRGPQVRAEPRLHLISPLPRGAPVAGQVLACGGDDGGSSLFAADRPVCIRGTQTAALSQHKGPGSAQASMNKNKGRGRANMKRLRGARD